MSYFLYSVPVFSKRLRRIALVSVVLVTLLTVYNYWSIKSAPTITVIYHSSDPVYGDVWVYDKPDRRCLSFSDPQQYDMQQSCINKLDINQVVHHYVQSMLASLFMLDDVSEMNRVLVIGLGGAVLVRVIQQLYPNVTMDIVEYNPIVAEVAHRFFYLRPNEKTHIKIQDGVEYLARNQGLIKYDLILVGPSLLLLSSN